MVPSSRTCWVKSMDGIGSLTWILSIARWIWVLMMADDGGGLGDRCVGREKGLRDTLQGKLWIHVQ